MLLTFSYSVRYLNQIFQAHHSVSFLPQATAGPGTTKLSLPTSPIDQPIAKNTCLAICIIRNCHKEASVKHQATIVLLLLKAYR